MAPLPSWSSGGEEPLPGAGGGALAPALSLTEPRAEVVAQVKLELATLAEPVLERLPVPSAVSADEPASVGAGQSVDKTLWVQCEAPGCGKWRRLPPTASLAHLPQNFDCSMAHWMSAYPASRCEVPEDQDTSESEGEEELGEQLVADAPAVREDVDEEDYEDEATKPAPQPTPKTPSSSLPSLARRRIEYCFEVGGESQWFSGTVQRDDAGDWVQVLFDDGDYLSVKVSPSVEGKVWRWLHEPGHRRDRSNQPAGAAASMDSKRKVAEHEAVPARSQATKMARSDAVAGVPKNKRAKKRSQYRGVTWSRYKGRWEAQIVFGLLGQDKSTNGAKLKHSTRRLGLFATELAAAQAYDAEARKLRPNGQAHGLRVGCHWQRVNFPTAREEAYAARQGMVTAEGRLAAALRAATQGFKSKFVGVHWNRRAAHWRAEVKHDYTAYFAGSFLDECQAARAYDELARKLRPVGKAHGMLFRNKWLRVNFPTDAEEAFAKASGLPRATPGDEKWM